MKTQLQYALAGKITPEMEIVSKKENVDIQWLVRQIANGKVVIPKNINHNFSVCGIGDGLSTKINANIGTSEKHCNFQEEIEKLEVAVKYGAHSVMDLSTGGNLHEILRNMIKSSPLMVGTVPIYGVASMLLREGKKIVDLDPEMLFNEIETQAKMGVDFMTLHCGINKVSLDFLNKSSRVCGVVSRGGAILKHWMVKNQKENPLYEHYDRVLDICEKYDVTISLGDGFRPGAGADATDRAQISELLVLGELAERARKRGVQVMIEGPGHMPFDQIAGNMMLMKQICGQAPLYVLGPLTTDIAPGYDHLVGAIGGTVAAINGANFLCYVTPAEHLCLPTIDDVKHGVIASRIAGHSADIVRNVPDAKEKDFGMSKARRDLDWEKIFEYAIDPIKARQRRESSESSKENVCTMCGDLCAVKNDRESIEDQII